MVRKLHFILLIAVIIILGINFYFMSNFGSRSEKPTVYVPEKQTDSIEIEKPVASKPNLIEISTGCNTDLDCSWQITNCCTENAGGYWQCISKESKIECNELVLCPQVISPKPEVPCSCIQGSCAPK